MNTCKYVCHYNSSKVSQLEKLKRYMESKDLRDFMYSNYRRFNWGMNDKCKFGASCDKTNRSDREFRQLTSELDELLSAYIEKPCHEHYHDILNLLRGYFPAVYKQFEMAIHQKGER